MNNQTPILSIGLPVYNSSEYIVGVIESLINQTFTEFEILISDDASTDETAEICMKYAATDRRILFFKQPSNIGMVDNQNFVLNKSKCRFFMWAAHDDYYDKDFIKLLLSILREDKSLSTVFCRYAVFDDKNNKIKYEKSLNYTSSFKIVQLLSFCIKFNDAPFYGIHRREKLINDLVPKWWGKNAITPANSNYPVVFFLLSSGKYAFYDGKPLFFKRSKAESYPLNPFYNGFNSYLYLILRKMNLYFISLQMVHRGSSSVFLTSAVTFPLLLRIIKDTVIDVYYKFKRVTLKKHKRNLSQQKFIFKVKNN